MPKAHWYLQANNTDSYCRSAIVKNISFPFFKIRDAGNWSSETLKMFEAYCLQFGKPDLLHVHSVLWAGYAASLIKEKHNIPYIITEHRGIFGLSCDWAKNQFIEWQDEYMQQAFSNADLIIPVSEKLIPKISSYLDRPVPMRVISNMVDSYPPPPRKKMSHQMVFEAILQFENFEVSLNEEYKGRAGRTWRGGSQGKYQTLTKGF